MDERKMGEWASGGVGERKGGMVEGWRGGSAGRSGSSVLPLFHSSTLPLLLAAAALLLPAGAGRAAGGGGFLPELERAAAALGARVGVTVWVDPAVAPGSPPRMPVEGSGLEAGLDALAASLPGGAWRRVFLAEGGSPLPPPARLAGIVRAVERLEPAAFAMEEVERGRVSLFRRERPVLPSQEAERRRGGFAARPVYLILSPRAEADGRAPADELAALERQLLDLAQRLPAEQAPNPAREAMASLGNLPPGERDAYMARVLEVGTQLWERTPPEQRQSMIDETLRVFERAGSAAGAAPPRNTLPELQRAASALGRREHVAILVDPAICVTHPPPAQAPGASLEEALRGLVAGLKGVGWRRVYLPAAQRRHLPPASTLAASARALDGLEPLRVAVESPRRGQVVTCIRDVEASHFREAGALWAAAEPLGDEPVELLYSTDSAAGQPLDRRYAAAQRRQFELLARMPPEQLARVMERGVERFEQSGAAGGAGVMSLPAMAALMAVWFPRQAHGGP